MALWVPANLGTAPYAIVDCRDVTWSGSTFSSLSNSGTGAGSWVISRATAPVKGTAVNAITPLNFDGTQGLKVTGQSTGTTVVYLAVTKVGTGINCLFSSEWSPLIGSPTGFAVYTRRSDSSLPTTNSDQFHTTATSGPNFNYYYQNSAAANTLSSLSVTSQSGADSGTRDGAAGTGPAGEFGTTTPVALTNKDLYCGDSGATHGPEGYTGDLFWAAMAGGITAGDLEKWQGWASWTFAGDGSLLPIGHTYKSSAPTFGSDPLAAFSTPQLDGRMIFQMIGY